MSAAFAWPPHVEPRSGQEQPPAQAPYRVPAYLADVFYLRNPDGGAPALVAVAACLGGELSAFAGTDFDSLPRDEPELTSQLQAVRVAQRDVFRTVEARELYVSTLDAIEQKARTAGYNDPVSVAGKLQARLSWDARSVSVLALDNSARMVVGRLDLLAAYRATIKDAFQNPRSAGGQTHHFLVPLAPAEAVERGEGLALLYPLLDPAVSAQADNTALAMRFAYDLLLRIQDDLRDQAALPEVTGRLFPVPSRAMLEEELAAEGYEVRGDIARRVRSGPPGADRPTFVEHLRRAFGWRPDDDVLLAPQAKPGDYARIIDEILPVVATTGDARMHAALDTARRVPARTAASSRPAPPPAPVSRQPAPARAPAPPAAPPPAVPRGRQRPQRDFSADFAPAAEPSRPKPPGSWERDFASTEWADPGEVDEPDRDHPPERNFAADFDP